MMMKAVFWWKERVLEQFGWIKVPLMATFSGAMPFSQLAVSKKLQSGSEPSWLS
jgi:hypothetical protein